MTSPTYDFPKPARRTVRQGNQAYQVPDATSLDRIIHRMQQDINTLSARAQNYKSLGPIDMNGNPIQGAVNSAAPADDELVTYGLMQEVASPAALIKEISILGDPTTQLNVQGLHGLLADPQTPVITSASSSDSKYVVGSFVGQTILLDGVLVTWNGTEWVPVVGATGEVIDAGSFGPGGTGRSVQLEILRGPQADLSSIVAGIDPDTGEAISPLSWGELYFATDTGNLFIGTPGYGAGYVQIGDMSGMQQILSQLLVEMEAMRRALAVIATNTGQASEQDFNPATIQAEMQTVDGTLKF